MSFIVWRGGAARCQACDFHLRPRSTSSPTSLASIQHPPQASTFPDAHPTFLTHHQKGSSSTYARESGPACQLQEPLGPQIPNFFIPLRSTIRSSPISTTTSSPSSSPPDSSNNGVRRCRPSVWPNWPSRHPITRVNPHPRNFLLLPRSPE